MKKQHIIIIIIASIILIAISIAIPFASMIGRESEATVGMAGDGDNVAIPKKTTANEHPASSITTDTNTEIISISRTDDIIDDQNGEKRAPIVNGLIFTNSTVSINYLFRYTDISNVCVIDEVLLKDGENILAVNSGNNSEGIFTNLLSDKSFNVCVNYHYDLDDGYGIIYRSFEKSTKTKAKVKPEVILNLNADVDYVNIQYAISDKDKTIKSQTIKLFDAANDKIPKAIKELDYTTSSELIGNVKITNNIETCHSYYAICNIVYNLNDGTDDVLMETSTHTISCYTPYEDFEYELSKEAPYTIKLIKYLGNSNKIYFANSYEIYGKDYYINEIADEAFLNKDITSITYDNNIKKFGRDAFYGCNKLSYVKYIGSLDDYFNIEYANLYSNPNTYAKLLTYEQDGITKQVSQTLELNKYKLNPYNLSGLPIKRLVISDNVKNVSYGALAGLYNLEYLSINFVGNNGDNETKESLFGYAFGEEEYYNSYKAIQMSSPSNSYTFYIPNTFSEVVIRGSSNIMFSAFKNVKSLKRVTISNTITSIGIDAFIGDINLDYLEIGSKVQSFGNSSFYINSVDEIYYNSDIKSWLNITFPNQTANPLKNANKFYYKDGSSYKLLKDLETPNDITKINSFAFFGYSGLETVKLPNVTTIEQGAFASCKNLSEISIYVINTVAQTPTPAFEDCINLKTIYNYEHLDIVKGSTDYGHIARYATTIIE